MNTATLSHPDTAAADQALADFFLAWLEADMRLSPMTASGLGDHRFDHLLDDLSPEARTRRLDFTRKTLASLPGTVSLTELSPDGQVDYQILRGRLELDLWLEETERPYENDPRIATSLATQCAYGLLTQSTLPAETNITNAIARIRLVPALLEQARASLGRPPRIVTETALSQNRGAITFHRTGILEMIGDSPQRETLRRVSGAAADALEHHQNWLEHDLLPRSTGEWRLGRECFAEKLERVLEAGVTADEVLADAQAQFHQTRRDMLIIARQLWAPCFPGQPLPPDDDEGRRLTIARVDDHIGQEHGRPETLAADARASAAALKAFITEHDLVRLPDPDRCRIIEMPEFQRGNSIAFLCPAPPLDPAAASIYAVSPPPQDWDPARVESFLREYNQRMLQILTLHEAYPGHYVQLDYANRHPSLIRRVLGSGVYAEGWANYCEQMLLDQGYGGGDPALRLMQLKFQLRGQANAILDHHMHAGRMTDEEAFHFLTAEAFQSEGEARLKVTRAKLGSCQLSTYFVGRNAFMRLRREVQRGLGDAFHAGRFHEALLHPASVPVKFLPELTWARLRLPR